MAAGYLKFRIIATCTTQWICWGWSARSWLSSTTADRHLALSPDGGAPEGKGLFFQKNKIPIFFPAKLVQAGEQCGTAVREENRCLLCLATAAVLLTHIVFQGGVKPCRLSWEHVAIVSLQKSTHSRHSFDSMRHIIHSRAHLYVLCVILHVIYPLIWKLCPPSKISSPFLTKKNRSQRNRETQYFEAVSLRGKDWCVEVPPKCCHGPECTFVRICG